MSNKILTTLNQALDVELYSILDPAGNPQRYNTLCGVPLGTVGNNSTGEIGVKVILVGTTGADDALATLQKSDPATLAVAVTPSDATTLDETRALWVGTAGDVVVTMAGGGVVTFPDVPAGYILPVAVTKVMAATTASGIVAMR